MRTNRPPADPWEALLRLYDCNRSELAARLGVTARTLRRWQDADAEGSGAGLDAHNRAADLLKIALHQAQALDLAQERIAQERTRAK
jgi:hypothetical protein